MNPRTTSPITTALAAPMTRRAALRAFAGAGAALVAATTVGQALANHTSTPYTVTANANFRTGPGTSYRIISVIRKGETFTLNAKEQNNYYEVTYKGTIGWVYAPLIVEAGAAPTDPRIIGTAKTTANVNLRSGPSTGHSILRVVPAGTTVQISDTVQNGYRYVNHDGLGGWIADQYLGSVNQPSGETATTTARLNLRAEPSTSAPIRLVIPSGAVVTLLAGTAPGWRQVSYQGTVGWAATDYLN